MNLLAELLPCYPPWFWPAAAAAVIFIGVAKAGFGGGAGVLGTPLMALTIPVGDAVALLLPLLIFCDIFSVWHYRSTFHRRSAGLLLPGAVIGIGVGTMFFGYFLGNQQVMRAGIGLLALFFVAYQVLRARLLGVIEARCPHAAEGVVMGAIAGFTSTLAHAGGPPVAVFLLPQRLQRQLFVGTTVIIFAAINLLKIGPYIWLDLYHVGNLVTVAVLTPPDVYWRALRYLAIGAFHGPVVHARCLRDSRHYWCPPADAGLRLKWSVPRGIGDLTRVARAATLTKARRRTQPLGQTNGDQLHPHKPVAPLLVAILVRKQRAGVRPLVTPAIDLTISTTADAPAASAVFLSPVICLWANTNTD